LNEAGFNSSYYCIAERLLIDNSQFQTLSWVRTHNQ
jgi:hypothetical protein